jgi:glycosyltransferase involved in cell wall biosynthesis
MRTAAAEPRVLEPSTRDSRALPIGVDGLPRCCYVRRLGPARSSKVRAPVRLGRDCETAGMKAQAYRNSIHSDSRSDRPFAFLVSTTGWARGIREHLGSAAYSYYFVLEALAPLLEQHGTCRLIDRAESRLPYLAAKAEAEGFRPVHLALNPPQDCYFTPAVPTIVFPFWEFPNIPNRDFGSGPRQNWARVCGPASLILTACRFTAEAFRRAGVRCPVKVVPVPLDPAHFTLPAWNPAHTWTITCRHATWGGDSEEAAIKKVQSEPDPIVAAVADPPSPVDRPRSWKWRVWLLARRAFRSTFPLLGKERVDHITRLKNLILQIAGRSPGTFERVHTDPPRVRQLVFQSLRRAYHRCVRRWLSAESLGKLENARLAVRGWAGCPTVGAMEPPLPSSSLALGGLIYTTIFNMGDERKNYVDLLSAFLLAFRDRPDVTLVIKLVTNLAREHEEVSRLRRLCEGFGVRHRCRVVVITEYLSNELMRELMRVTTYYVNTSHAEGACLPLQQALAGGRPALAPAHSALAEYMDDHVGFVLETHPEPTWWPHNPEHSLETYWHRLVWSSLHDQLLTSSRVAWTDRPRYANLAASAQDRMLDYASREVAGRALREALELLPEVRIGAFSWAQ